MNAMDGTVDGLWAYVMSRTAAKKIAEMRFVLDEPADRWLSLKGLSKLNTYVWHPSVVKYRPSGI
jgi:hypothetical protein